MPVKGRKIDGVAGVWFYDLRSGDFHQSHIDLRKLSFSTRISEIGLSVYLFNFLTTSDPETFAKKLVLLGFISMQTIMFESSLPLPHQEKYQCSPINYKIEGESYKSTTLYSYSR